MLLAFLNLFGFWPEYDCFNGPETIITEYDFGDDRSEIDYFDKQDD